LSGIILTASKEARSIVSRSHHNYQEKVEIMTDIIVHQIDNISVGIDKKDGYLNATKLCIAYNFNRGTNKQPSDWVRSKKATEYIAYVSSVRGIPRTGLVVLKQGGTDREKSSDCDWRQEVSVSGYRRRD
jgi:KilA-N domain